MALTEDRMTPHQGAELAVVGVAAAAILFGGGMVAVNAAGYAVPAADTAGLKVIGVSEGQVDNSAGANGDLVVTVRHKKVFIFKNSATHPVVTADLWGDVYVEDDETISNNGAINDIVAGTLVAITQEGVAVEIS